MSNWRERILSEFAPGAARLTLVADPDGLLLEEDISAAVRGRGFALLEFDDPVAFRYAYESGFRSRWDRGEEADAEVVLRFAGSDLGALPYDLLQAGRRLSFSLAEMFPGLSPLVSAALDRADFDALDAALAKRKPGALGDNASKDFVLRHVFGIEPERIETAADLLGMLLRRHCRGLRVPALLDERLIAALRRRGGFAEWPLEAVVGGREAFFAFLQERWPVFLDRMAGAGKTGEGTPRRFEFPGPADLPFDHDDVSVFIDNLFREGFLQAAAHERGAALSGTRFALGVRRDERAERERRLDGLAERMDAPAEDAGHEDWLRFARTWAELGALVAEADADLPQGARRRMELLRERVDGALAVWLGKRYAGLSNLPLAPPVMLHHAPRFMAGQIEDGGEGKAALVVVDGLALQQWLVVRGELARQRPRLRFRESAVFAWVPTVTSVSRQALFAGQPPLHFAESIRTTDKEPALWRRFWEDRGMRRGEVGYVKGLGGVGSLERAAEMLGRPGLRVAGLVVDTVDRIAHGMRLGMAGMHNQARQWAAQPFLAQLVDLLLGNGFGVWLTSDHGNIEAVGCGRPAEGAAAEMRGERARIYDDALLRGRVKERFPEAVEWPPVGLPEDFLPLLAGGRTAFTRRGERTVGHGGASLEEIAVPLARIESGEA